MDSIIHNFLLSLPTLVLFFIIAITMYTLGKGADILVAEAASLSHRFGVPKMIIGATIISLGTTLPETTVSVFAAFEGNPDLALGNAIGSIIVDTSLIIGLAAIFGYLPIDRITMKRQGKLQLFAVILIAFVCLPFLSDKTTGNISQFTGFIFLILLVLYIFVSIYWAKSSEKTEEVPDMVIKPMSIQILKLILGLTMIIISSKILIPTIEISAFRIGIPQSIIAATIVAFGTSLPELVTAITAVRRGHGELAVGNIVGADILNVLFVTGSAAAVTMEGLDVPEDFYKLQIPAMLIAVIVFQILASSKKNRISKLGGLLLVGIYVIYIALNYVLTGNFN